jgi:hypothetical protein
VTQQPTQRPDRAATLARTAAALAADLVVLQRRQQEAVAISDATGMLFHYWVLDYLSGGVGSPPATSHVR